MTREGGWEGASWGGGVAEGREDLRLVNIYLFTGEMPTGPLAQVEALPQTPYSSQNYLPGWEVW